VIEIEGDCAAEYREIAERGERPDMGRRVPSDGFEDGAPQRHQDARSEHRGRQRGERLARGVALEVDVREARESGGHERDRDERRIAAGAAGERDERDACERDDGARHARERHPLAQHDARESVDEERHRAVKDGDEPRCEMRLRRVRQRVVESEHGRREHEHEVQRRCVPPEVDARRERACVQDRSGEHEAKPRSEDRRKAEQRQLDGEPRRAPDGDARGVGERRTNH